jgi:hypothetical protein
MLYICVWIMEGRPLISEVVLSQLAFDTYVAWVALPGTIFDRAALMPLGAIDAFVGIAFRTDTLAHFQERRTPVSLFLFFVASSHAQSQALGEAHRVHWLARKLYSPDLHSVPFQHKTYALRRHTSQQRSPRQPPPSPRSDDSSPPGV